MCFRLNLKPGPLGSGLSPFQLYHALIDPYRPKNLFPSLYLNAGGFLTKKPFEVSIRPLSSILYTLVTYMTWIPTSTSSFIVVQVTQRAVRFCLFKQPSLLRNSHTCARAIEQDSHKVQFLEHKNLLYSSQKQNRTEDGFSKSTNSHILSVTARRVL